MSDTDRAGAPLTDTDRVHVRQLAERTARDVSLLLRPRYTEITTAPAGLVIYVVPHILAHVWIWHPTVGRVLATLRGAGYRAHRMPGDRNRLVVTGTGPEAVRRMSAAEVAEHEAAIIDRRMQIEQGEP